MTTQAGNDSNVPLTTPNASEGGEPPSPKAKSHSLRKGRYYQLRTKKWLEQEGYLVANLERSASVWGGKGKTKRFWVKKDIWGGDLAARDENELIWIQVKSARSSVSSGKKELSQGPWPPFVKRWVVWWPPRRPLEEGPEIWEVTT